MNNPDIDYQIIIPAYNEANTLPHTLEQVNNIMASITTHRGTVIVVDNNSTDDTAKVAQAHGVQVVYEAKRQIARARNAGAVVSSAQYLIFLDADTLPTEVLLREVLVLLDSGKVIGGGTKVWTHDKLTFLAKFGLKFWAMQSRLFTWAAGCFVFCTRDALQQVGGFDERYYAAEELYLSVRMKKLAKAQGKKFVILIHPVYTSLRKLYWFSTRELITMSIKLVLCPWRIKKQADCDFWYKRPKE